MLGQTARFERFAADMLYMIASGRKYDMDAVEMFGKQVDEVWKNPFGGKEHKLTTEEIVNGIIGKLQAVG